MTLRHNCLLLMLISHLTAWAQFPVAILAGDYPDPSIVRDGEDYYMTHTANYYQPGFLIWHNLSVVPSAISVARLGRLISRRWATPSISTIRQEGPTG